jgi:putative OPT family oligopeptide transporter
MENNIVQTVASAAGTLSAIIFVLPGLVIVGWWHGFPYWMTMAATGLGGILGVMFSVPLRRALVVNTDLPYPEGRAAAEVLVGRRPVARRQRGEPPGAARHRGQSIASAAYFALSQTRLVVDEAAVYFRVGAGSTGISSSLSMALVGVGHLVGISVGMAMLVGIVFSWGILVPMLTAACGVDAIPLKASHWRYFTPIFDSSAPASSASLLCGPSPPSWVRSSPGCARPWRRRTPAPRHRCCRWSSAICRSSGWAS